MLIPAPLLDADCLAKIIRGEKIPTMEVGPFLVILGGDARKWPIQKNTTFGVTEVKDAFAVAGLSFDKLEDYKSRYCSGTPAPVLN